MPRPRPPSGFVTIGPGIYLSIAPPGMVASEPNDTGPNVILIFGWMGALTRHLEHYARKYNELYPSAIQLIVKCGPSVFWSSAKKRENRLLPVVEALESLGCLPSNNNLLRDRPRILVHSFSNGGGFQMMSVGRLLATKYPSIPPAERLINALVLDSSPAIGTFTSIGRAFSVAIRNPVSRFIALPFIYIVYAYFLLLQMLFGWETTSTKYYKTLLQPRILPWMNHKTPRLYVFSKKDDMVPWEEVQRHAETVKESGLAVHCEIYEESPHVAHMRRDPHRYWGSIQCLWKTARKHQVKTTDVA